MIAAVNLPNLWLNVRNDGQHGPTFYHRPVGQRSLRSDYNFNLSGSRHPSQVEQSLSHRHGYSWWNRLHWSSRRTFNGRLPLLLRLAIRFLRSTSRKRNGSTGKMQILISAAPFYIFKIIMLTFFKTVPYSTGGQWYSNRPLQLETWPKRDAVFTSSCCPWILNAFSHTNNLIFHVFTKQTFFSLNTDCVWVCHF